MNRCRISVAFYNSLVSHIKIGDGLRKEKLWIKKWKPTLDRGMLFYKGKHIIPREAIEEIMKKEITKNGAPMTSRDSLFKYLFGKYWGISKRDCEKFLKKQEFYQLSKVRPYQNTRVNKEKKEGATQALLRGKYGKNMNVGVDLFFVPQNTEHFSGWGTRYKYLYVAVVQTCNYVFAYGMVNKKAVTARNQAEKLWRDCFKIFGKYPSGIVSDAGTEFEGAHRHFVEEKKGVVQRTSDKATFVERRISILARNIGICRDHFGYSFDESLKLALEKTNNMYSRKIKKAPSQVTGKDVVGLKHYNKKLKYKPRVKKQPVFKLKDRVRHLTKYSTDVNQKFYKSYTSGRDKNTAIWSKPVYTVIGKKKKNRLHQYFLSNNKWFYPYELQLVPFGVMKLNVDIPKKKRAKPKKTVTFSGDPGSNVWSELSPENVVESPRKTVSEPGRRRSSRQRKAPQRFADLRF